jgi:isoleucyl-tRNA synthetase
MDKWIIAATENLIKTVKFNMGKYDLSASVPKLIQFLE